MNLSDARSIVRSEFATETQQKAAQDFITRYTPAPTDDGDTLLLNLRRSHMAKMKQHIIDFPESADASRKHILDMEAKWKQEGLQYE